MQQNGKYDALYQKGGFLGYIQAGAYSGFCSGGGGDIKSISTPSGVRFRFRDVYIHTIMVNPSVAAVLPKEAFLLAQGVIFSVL